MYTSKAKRAAEHLELALRELIPLEESKEMFLMLIREIEHAIPALESIHLYQERNQ